MSRQSAGPVLVNLPTFEAKLAEKNETNAAGILTHACAKSL